MTLDQLEALKRYIEARADEARYDDHTRSEEEWTSFIFSMTSSDGD